MSFAITLHFILDERNSNTKLAIAVHSNATNTPNAILSNLSITDVLYPINKQCVKYTGYEYLSVNLQRFLQLSTLPKKDIANKTTLPPLL